MADSQFNPLGSVTAPADWTLPASLNLLLKNVYASYDGTSAAGSFQPALQIISDSGHTVGTYPCSTTVAAGGSADVTWFPGLGAAAGKGVVAAWVSKLGQTFAVGSNHVVVWTVANFLTNDTTAFSLPSGTPMILNHGGFVRTDVTINFGPDGGVPYSGAFELQTSILDANNVSVAQTSGPNYNVPELYSTAAGDFFKLSGTATFNCDDSTLTPPYKLSTTVTNLTQITTTNMGLVVSIETPNGLV